MSLLKTLFARTPKAPAARKAALRVEGLEAKALCSVSASLDTTGVLRVSGTAGDDQIQVDQNDGYVQVNFYNPDIGDWDQAAIAGRGHGFSHVPEGAVGRVVINGFGGNDSLDAYYSHTKPVTIFGGDGDDTITGGSRADVLRGEAGNDQIVGLYGNDQISGGDGNDEMYGGLPPWMGDPGMTDGNDTIDGGAGYDFIDGGLGNDLLRGGTEADAILGGGGNDQLFGGSGDDYLNGNDGNDRMFGQDGNDMMYGAAGNDAINGGTGDDQLYGGIPFGPANDGNDVLIGAQGLDSLDGGDGFNKLRQDF
jgi:Ca2+-binding RTX toxin-like protein